MSKPVTAEEMETWAAVNERHGQNLTARYLRAGAAAIRDRDAALRRLAEYEAALHEIRVGKVQADNEHPQGEDFSMAIRFHRIAKEALAHREGQ